MNRLANGSAPTGVTVPQRAFRPDCPAQGALQPWSSFDAASGVTQDPRLGISLVQEPFSWCDSPSLDGDPVRPDVLVLDVDRHVFASPALPGEPATRDGRTSATGPKGGLAREADERGNRLAVLDALDEAFDSNAGLAAHIATLTDDGDRLVCTLNRLTGYLHRRRVRENRCRCTSRPGVARLPRR